MKLKKKLIKGNFINRDNRFRATVLIDGKEAYTHVPNSGRMWELLTPNVGLWLTKADDPNRKTAYDLRLVEHNNILVSVDSRLPNPLFHESILSGKIDGFGYSEIRREVTRIHSRFDFRLSGKGVCWVETKSVNFVKNGVAQFPDAPTTRGQKHVAELIEVTQTDEKAAVVFIIQRPDAHIFMPKEDTDPKFAELLKKAQDNGVIIRAFLCDVNLEGVEVTREIPIKI